MGTLEQLYYQSLSLSTHHLRRNPSVDSTDSNHLDIFQIYCRYCDIRSGKWYELQNSGDDDELRCGKSSKDALAQLLKFVESWLHTSHRISVFDELLKLMSRLQFMVDFSEFSRFYDFVFFMCREHGQKNITVNKAIAAWKLVLAGRFRLLNEWCDFVQDNQRYNISEDTWQQVLAFSRCVHENLEGYDPEGAWPVMIDEFVEHMYRVFSSNKDSKFVCNCVAPDSQSCVPEDSLPGLKITPGSKRKLPHFQLDETESPDILFPDFTQLNLLSCSKRNRLVAHRPLNLESNSPSHAADECTANIRQCSPLGSLLNHLVPLKVACLGAFKDCSQLVPILQLDPEIKSFLYEDV